MRLAERSYYTFGPFDLDREAKVLFRDGQPIQLAPKTIETLLVLVRNPNRVLTKDEMLRAIWPDRVVEEVNLAQHISLLRKALGPDYIRTFPARGYQFIHPVTEAVPAAEPEQPKHAGSGRWHWGVAGAIAFMAAAAATGAWYSRWGQSEPGPPHRAPVSRLPGAKSHPALSPDGTKIAFVWDAGGESGPCIYIQSGDGRVPTQLPASCGNPGSPAWSPAGDTVAWLRHGGSATELVLTPLSGPERVLTRLFPVQYLLGNRLLDWSPDGQWIAVSDKSEPEEPLALTLFSPKTGERRRLTSASTLTIGDTDPRFSPDGSQFAFVRMSNRFSHEVCVVASSGGQPRCSSRGNQQIGGLAWAGAGADLVFSSNRSGDFRLWRSAATGDLNRASPDPSGVFADSPIQLSICAKRPRLVYVAVGDDLNIWRLKLPGGQHGEGGWHRLIASTGLDAAPQYAPDGSRICFLSNRSGKEQLWVAGSDGTNARQITQGNYMPGPGRWTPDGRNIVFYAHNKELTGLYTIPAGGGEPRRILITPSGSLPVVSQDGQWIFTVAQSGPLFQIFRAPIAGGRAVQFTQGGGHRAQPSPDGHYLYYSKGRLSRSIWRISVDGSKEEPVLDQLMPGYFGYWAVAGDALYYLGNDAAPSGRAIFRYDLRTRQSVRVATVPDPLPSLGTAELTASPDGRNLLVVRQESGNSDLMALDPFS